MDAFLVEVRSSEKLLQELQDRLRSVGVENERVQADESALKKEQHILGEESLRNEQELATVCSKTLFQDVRLRKVMECIAQVKRDLDADETELSSVKEQLESEINQLCLEAAQHVAKFGLVGSYRAEAKQQKLDELLEAKTQTDQLSRGIEDLQQREAILKHELQKLADIEEDIENKRQTLRQPLQNRERVQELQQTLCRLAEEQRDGRHLQQLKSDISDAEDETTCLRSAASAMSAELQRLEQLIWFNNMEKMKQRMKATAKCPGQYHCGTAGSFNGDMSNTGSSASARMGPSKLTRSWPVRSGSLTTLTANNSSTNRDPVQIYPEARPAGAKGHDADCDDLGQPQDWSAPEAEMPAGTGAGMAGSEAPEGSAAAPTPPPPVAVPPPTARATPATSGSGVFAAELAQRRWRARRALMMARRQPSAPHQPPPAASPAPAAPPLASVRPQLRPQETSRPADPRPLPDRREWGHAAAPGRLSYRGPQPGIRVTTDFRTSLQKLREEMSCRDTAPQKKVRFSADPPQEEIVHGDDDMDDFL